MNAGLQALAHSEAGADLTHNRACMLAARQDEDLLLEPIKALQVIRREWCCLNNTQCKEGKRERHTLVSLIQCTKQGPGHTSHQLFLPLMLLPECLPW